MGIHVAQTRSQRIVLEKIIAYQSSEECRNV